MNKAGIAVAAVLLAGVAGAAYVFSDEVPGMTPTGQVAKDAFELSTGSDLEVMKVEDDGSLDRVVLSDGDDVIETYVTSDGKYLVQNPIDLEQRTETLEARNDFIGCLEEQNARFYGIIAQDQNLAEHTQATQLQIQALGGLTGLEDLFAGPGTTGFPQEQVTQHGVVWQLPNGEVQGGLMTIPELEEATGCSYDAELPNATQE